MIARKRCQGAPAHRKDMHAAWQEVRPRSRVDETAQWGRPFRTAPHFWANSIDMVTSFRERMRDGKNPRRKFANEVLTSHPDAQ